MSRSLLHDWEGSIERNKNNTEELLNIAEDIYNTAYTRGKASTERPQGEWEEINERIGTLGEDNIYTSFKCPFCGYVDLLDNNYCGNCGADLRGKEE